MRTLKYEQALAELAKEAETFGIDLVAKSPVDILMKSMGVGRSRASVLLGELKARDFISLVYIGIGNAIVKAVIKKKKLPERFYEVDEKQRLIEALWQLRRRSQNNSAINIVHSLSFEEVRALADIQQAKFYILLGEFEKNGWIEYFRSSENRIIYIVLTEKFPAP